jgi:NADPH-dependent ferric siderophore reductase
MYDMQLIRAHHVARSDARHELAAKLFISAAQVVQVPGLYFLARPGSLAQKSQAGFYAWVACETAHVNSLRQSFPAMTIHQDGQDGFKSHALKWIVRMLSHSM